MTNQEKFIEVFGIDFWRKMVSFFGTPPQFDTPYLFMDFWTSPYNQVGDNQEKEVVG